MGVGGAGTFPVAGDATGLENRLGASERFGEGREGWIHGRAGVGGRAPRVSGAPGSSLLRTAFLLLLLVAATWLLGLLAVNSDALAFHYLFAVCSCLQVGSWPRDLAATVWASLGRSRVIVPPAV